MLVSNGLPYAIGIGAPTTQVATVTIEADRGPNASLRQITQVMVPAKSSTIIAVNGTGGVLAGQDHAVGSVGARADQPHGRRPLARRRGQPATALADFGDVVEFASTASLVALGDQPFMLVQYMMGCYDVISQTACRTTAAREPLEIRT
jgi:hypothetical protein